jgi:AraC-like DNA-binding protein
MAYKFHFQPAPLKLELVLNDQVLSNTELSISWFFYCLNNIIFNIAAFFPLYKYKKNLQTNPVSSEKLNLTLLTIVLVGFMSKTIIETIRYMTFLFDMYDKILPLYLICLVDSYIFISILTFSVLKRPEIFNQIKSSIKYGTSPLTSIDVQIYSEKLKAYMNENKPYLDESLNLENLAMGINIAPRYLSQVINQAFNQNFSDFVNSYRINYAIEQLSGRSNNKTISEIYFEAGFKSKATFYKAFKKHQNVTPTIFRKETTFISSN